MRPETFAAMAATPAVCEHLHYPLQSGSDRVLALMHRGYTAERYLERLAQARAAVPDLAVSTDIIVGFPGETDDDFERTLEVAAAARVRLRLHVHLLAAARAPRPPTCRPTSSTRPWRASGSQRLRVVVERSALLQHEARVGRVEEVIVEGPSKKNPSVVTGRTRQNKLVHFEPPHPLRTGSYAMVEITRGAPHHLDGRFVELVAEPVHKIRIPVAAL